MVKGPGIKPGRAQGNIYLLDVLGKKLVRVVFQIEQLCLAHLAVQHVVFDEFPVAFADAAHAGFGAAAVDAEEGIADGFLFAFFFYKCL